MAISPRSHRLVNQLPVDDRARVQPFIAHVIDQVNLVWLMRYRLGYGMTPPHTFFLLVRTSGQLDRTRLAALAQLDSLDAMIDALPRSAGVRARGRDQTSARWSRASSRVAWSVREMCSITPPSTWPAPWPT